MSKNKPTDTVRCNNCEWHGEESDLEFVLEDERDLETGMNACPNCKTDEYLTNIEKPTRTLFRKWRTGKQEVFALFIDEAASSTNPVYCNSFQHVGQHGGANPQGCIYDSTRATPDEYAELKLELESDPYNYIIEVVQKTPSDSLERRRAQIKALTTPTSKSK